MRRLILSVLLLAGLASAGAVRADVRLSVAGGDTGLDAGLRAVSVLVAAGDPTMMEPQDILSLARSDYRRILAFLYENSYFGGTVSILLDGREAAAISPFRAALPMRNVEIRVDPGSPFRLGVAEIGPLAPGTDLPGGFASGAPATTPVLRQAAEAAISGWRAEGHAAATIAGQRILARNDAAELDAQITITPGPETFFGHLHPQGQSRMHPDRIQQIAGLPEGTRFDPATLTRVAGRLRDSGAFSSVSLEEQPPGPNGQLDITATLVEEPLRRLGFGAELSSTDGATVSAYWLHRNLFGGAERLRLDAEASGLGGGTGGYDGRIAALFSRPATLTPDTTLALGASIEHLDEVTYTTDTASLSFGLTHWFSEDLEGSIALEPSRERITDAFSQRDVTLLAVPVSLTWDSRDTALDATSGQYLDGTATPFAITGGGGARLSLDARGYLGFGEADRSRLAARIQMGTLAGGDVGVLPPDWLFFSGGAGTVRGQGYQSLGAIQSGVATGGRSFFGTSVEWRQDLFGNFGGVAFVDTGFISADSWFRGDSGWQAGAGIGLRYDTAIGPIRLDVAVPLDGGGGALYIGIGQAF